MQQQNMRRNLIWIAIVVVGILIVIALLLSLGGQPNDVEIENPTLEQLQIPSPEAAPEP